MNKTYFKYYHNINRKFNESENLNLYIIYDKIIEILTKILYIFTN